MDDLVLEIITQEVMRLQVATEEATEDENKNGIKVDLNEDQEVLTLDHDLEEDLMLQEPTEVNAAQEDTTTMVVNQEEISRLSRQVEVDSKIQNYKFKIQN